MTIVDNKEAIVVGKLSRVPETVGLVTIELSCIVSRIIPYYLIVGSPSMKMIASLDFDKDVANFCHQEGVMGIQFAIENMLNNSSLSDVFTSDDDERNSQDGTEDEADEPDEDEVVELEEKDNCSPRELELALTEEANQQLGGSEEEAVNELLEQRKGSQVHVSCTI